MAGQWGYPWGGYPYGYCTLREHCYPACCWGNGYCGPCAAGKEGVADDFKEEIKVDLEDKDLKAVRFLNQVKGSAAAAKEAKEAVAVAENAPGKICFLLFKLISINHLKMSFQAENKQYVWNNGYYNGMNWPYNGQYWNNGWYNGWYNNGYYNGWNGQYAAGYAYGWCRAKTDCGGYCCWGNGFCGACKKSAAESAGNSTSY